MKIIKKKLFFFLVLRVNRGFSTGIALSTSFCCCISPHLSTSCPFASCIVRMAKNNQNRSSHPGAHNYREKKGKGENMSQDKNSSFIDGDLTRVVPDALLSHDQVH